MFKGKSSASFRRLTTPSQPSASIPWQNLRVASLRQQWSLPIHHARTLQTDIPPANEVPFRKKLKDEARRKREAKRLDHEDGLNCISRGDNKRARQDKWKLTVGLEIHAQLNSERKLFSSAKTSDNDEPNHNVALFDLAFPGSQPEFQKATLIPALRAATSLSCTIQRKSKFDRKHYYYQDQPAGYQITQYYEPFAKNGIVKLYDHDGIAQEDGENVSIEIKQIQMEQDTAKSTLQPPSTALLDFNRVGHPLIEMITHPQIHHPQTAAACVKKIQAILQTAKAVTTGMEMGGLRTDVNVSVSPVGCEFLGQRTEIKNLSSIKAVEDAIVAERDRQIAILEAGGSIDGETRGWTLGSTETIRLRGKEGEVDYRYMPDPDIPPLVIGDDLTKHIHRTLPTLPDELIADLVADGLTVKDAKTLVSLDNGERLDYLNEVRLDWAGDRLLHATDPDPYKRIEYAWHICVSSGTISSRPIDKIVANWTLNELGGLLSAANVPFSPTLVPPTKMAHILIHYFDNKITGPNAKRLLSMVFDGDKRSIERIIKEKSLALKSLPQEVYVDMAQALLDENDEKVKQIQQKKQLGKLKWFVGQMVRQGEGNVEAGRAEFTLKGLLGLP